MFCCVIGITMDLPSVSGFKIYQNRIPNGDKIPDPCRKNQYWNGVGHRKSIGGGQRNPFGTHFRQLGKTRMEMDSTNGEELGDPDCSWSVGITLNKTNDLSHPGICEPLTSEACRSKNDWLDCTDEELKCDAFKEKGVKNITLRFPLVKVARKETTYVCMLFKLPTDGDYQIIGEKPIIANDYVLHHMVLFGCKYLEGWLVHIKEL
ncbi:hypothetical protein KUTeg_019147 [Tegillarca granosa]|uniref:Uncharacterized protein n=1 Tax=Tegillarca granosa TaxID=220873 RepID=A0ABQ9EBM8_TEGGR|nr:hypothetical protein KUTeg_019147 [Tegillarca granosa]